MHFLLQKVMSQGDIVIIYLHVGLHTCNVRTKVGFIISIQNWLGANGVDTWGVWARFLIVL